MTTEKWLPIKIIDTPNVPTSKDFTIAVDFAKGIDPSRMSRLIERSRRAAAGLDYLRQNSEGTMSPRGYITGRNHKPLQMILDEKLRDCPDQPFRVRLDIARIKRLSTGGFSLWACDWLWGPAGEFTGVPIEHLLQVDTGLRYSMERRGGLHLRSSKPEYGEISNGFAGISFTSGYDRNIIFRDFGPSITSLIHTVDYATLADVYKAVLDIPVDGLTTTLLPLLLMEASLSNSAVSGRLRELLGVLEEPAAFPAVLDSPLLMDADGEFSLEGLIAENAGCDWQWDDAEESFCPTDPAIGTAYALDAKWLAKHFKVPVVEVPLLQRTLENLARYPRNELARSLEYALSTLSKQLDQYRERFERMPDLRVAGQVYHDPLRGFLDEF